MPNLVFCLNVYAEHQLLPDCIQSIRSNTPAGTKIVGVDGAYRVFVEQAKIEAAEAIKARNGILADSFLRFTSPASNDGTLEILRAQADIIVECHKNAEGNPIPWENEYVKRSQYFKGSPGDVYIVLDADERIITSKQITIDNVLAELGQSDHGCIMLKRDDGIPSYPIMRIHKHFDGMRYEGAHHALWVNDQLIKKDDLVDSGIIVKGFSLHHRWTERAESDRVRHITKGRYYNKLMDSEGSFRTKHKI